MAKKKRLFSVHCENLTEMNDFTVLIMTMVDVYRKMGVSENKGTIKDRKPVRELCEFMLEDFEELKTPKGK